MECSTRSGALPSKKHAANRGSRLSRRSVSRSSSEPPSELIVPPSKRATTCCEKCPLNSKWDWVHCVIAKATRLLVLTACLETPLCHERRLLATDLSAIWASPEQILQGAEQIAYLRNALMRIPANDRTI